MNNNLRFPISDIASELYGRMYNFAKQANVDAINDDVTIIDETNKYELRYNNYKKYLKIGEDSIQNVFYGAFCNVTEKGYSIILTITQFKMKRLSFAGEHLQMRKQGYEYLCYPSKRNASFVFISPSGSIKFNLPSSNKAVWLSLSNINKFPFNYFGLILSPDQNQISKKLLFNNKKNEWCENHLEIKRGKKTPTLSKNNNFTKSSYGSCSSLQQFINKIKTINEPLSHKQFAGLSFDDIYEIMSVAPIFKNPINYIDNFKELKKIDDIVYSEYKTYLDDLIKMANDVGQKINFSLNKDNIKEQHDRILLDNIDKMKVKQIHVHDKYLILEKYLPKQFKMIKDGKELLFEGLTQKHCVNSYSDNINRGDCCILTTEYNEKRYTAEISFGKYNWLDDYNKEIYRINQFKGYANSSVPSELMSKLQDVINEVNKKEKKYISKIKGPTNDPFETHEVVEYLDNPF